jgi:hypothetical protein
VKISILKYDHRHGTDLSAYTTYDDANEARAKICAQFVDARIYTADADNGDEDDTKPRTVSERVKTLFEAKRFDECVEVYLKYNQDESLDIDEVELTVTSNADVAALVRVTRERDEALRMLNKKTNMRWDNVIAQRALPWWSHKTCETCMPVVHFSRGTQRSAADGIEPSRCETCKGEGEVWEAKLHDPNGPPCSGCPNSNCSDYELCARKKNPS